MSMIDDEYDVQVTANEMRNANTIQDLINLIEEKRSNMAFNPYSLEGKQFLLLVHLLA